MAVNGKAKGNKGERDLAKWWKDWSGLEFSRVPQSGGLRWQKTDDISGDIIPTDKKGTRRFPFSIESKSYRDLRFEHIILGNTKVKILEFWAQAKADGLRGNKYPILFFRYNGMKKYTWFLMIRYEEFKYLDKKLFEFPYFDLTTNGERVIIMNSTDALKTDYHKFIKSIKIKRNGEKRK